MAFTRTELVELYGDKGLSTRQIAKANGVTRATVVYHMKKFGIPRREGNQPKPFSHDELHELYVTRRMSTHQIAKLKGCAHATVISCLRRVGIKLRKRRKALFGRKITLTEKFLRALRKNQAKRWSYLKENPPFTEEELRELYLKKGLGTREIAKMKSTTHRRVLSWMKRYDIGRRSFAHAQKKYIESHPERLEQMVLALRKGCRHPNKLEEKLLQFLVKHNFPFKYVGNGSVSIGGLCPDFVATNGSPKVIELFGGYWHKPEEEQERISEFKKLSYDALIIWEHELRNEDALINKIESWMEG
jgi:hypothetical protein